VGGRKPPLRLGSLNFESDHRAAGQLL
jgi:hypothetical protein